MIIEVIKEIYTNSEVNKNYTILPKKEKKKGGMLRAVCFGDDFVHCM